MQLKNIIPWRIRHRVDLWMENNLRPQNPTIYKILKFGRTNINTPRYWDEVWRTDNLDRNYTDIFKIILDAVTEGSKVLDVGCGIGNLARLLRDQRNAQVTGLDFSQWACDQLAKEGFNTVVSILPRIPLPDAHYDIAVTTEVLEHLDKPEKTLKEMARVVRPGGLVICSVPDDSLHPHEELEHQQSFTKPILRSMLNSISSKIEIVHCKSEDKHEHDNLIGIAWVR